MKEHFSNFRVVDAGCFSMGPYPNRKLSNIAWVEFVSADVAQEFYKKVTGSDFPCEVQGTKILIKGARAETQRDRNTTLKKAAELIKKSPESKDKNVEIVWKVTENKSRQVKVNDTVAFIQLKDDRKVSFGVPYDGLMLP